MHPTDLYIYCWKVSHRLHSAAKPQPKQKLTAETQRTEKQPRKTATEEHGILTFLNSIFPVFFRVLFSVAAFFYQFRTDPFLDAKDLSASNTDCTDRFCEIVQSVALRAFQWLRPKSGAFWQGIER